MEDKIIRKLEEIAAEMIEDQPKGKEARSFVAGYYRALRDVRGVVAAEREAMAKAYGQEG
ncbi:MAG: hypothetical protein PHI12_10940 [Dehalococcoidales bacterium]|nr:hypothetical protein [Dehalococcoidales bacterium]